jgi:hypothetical protein
MWLVESALRKRKGDNMAHVKVAALFLLLGAAATGAVQHPTIPEVVAAHPELKSHKMTRVMDARVTPLQELAAKADLVVVGQLGKPTSYLTSDAHEILTDYEVIPRQVLIDRASTAVSARPGQIPSSTVTVHGGEIVVNGVTVTLFDLGRVNWREGADLLLFLVRDADKSNRFWLLNEAAGAFEVAPDRRLKSLKKGEKGDEVHGVQLEEVIKRIIASRGR